MSELAKFMGYDIIDPEKLGPDLDRVIEQSEKLLKDNLRKTGRVEQGRATRRWTDKKGHLMLSVDIRCG